MGGGTDQLSSFEHHIIKSNRSITAKLLPNKGELIDKDVRITRSMILPSLSWGKIIKVDLTGHVRRESDIEDSVALNVT